MNDENEKLEELKNKFEKIVKGPGAESLPFSGVIKWRVLDEEGNVKQEGSQKI